MYIIWLFVAEIAECEKIAILSGANVEFCYTGHVISDQSGFQSGLETAPLAAVIAGYCNSLSHFKIEVVLSYIFLKMFFAEIT